MSAVQLRALRPGATFRVAEGYLRQGGTSDAGVLTYAPTEDQPRTGNRVRTTDGRDLHPATLVLPVDLAEEQRIRSEYENTRRREWRRNR